MGEEPRCLLRELARLLGVSQAYVQKLVRQFTVNPPKQLERTVRGYGGFSVSVNGQLHKPRVRILATFEELREAQEQSDRMRERGYLRTTFKGNSYQFPGTPEISKKNRTN